MIHIAMRIIRYKDYKIISDRGIYNNAFDFYIKGCISALFITLHVIVEKKKRFILKPIKCL